MSDRLTELMYITAVLNHLVHQLWVREFAKSENPIVDATYYVSRINEALANAPDSDFPEAAADMRQRMILFFETVLVTLRREAGQGSLDA